MKFKAEISEKEIPFLDTTVFKGERFYEDAILDIRTLFLTDISIHGFHFLSRSQPRSQGSLLPALLVNPDSLRRAGSILGDPGAVSRAGRKGATKVFKHRRKSLWVSTLTGPFPNGQAIAGS